VAAVPGLDDTPDGRKLRFELGSLRRMRSERIRSLGFELVVDTDLQSPMLPDLLFLDWLSVRNNMPRAVADKASAYFNSPKRKIFTRETVRHSGRSS
jgi:hypothetical protein